MKNTIFLMILIGAASNLALAASKNNETLKQATLENWGRVEKLVNSKPEEGELDFDRGSLSCIANESLEQKGLVGACTFLASGKGTAVDFAIALTIADSPNAKDPKQYAVHYLSKHID